MRKLFFLLAFCIAALASTSAFAQITGSAHDTRTSYGLVTTRTTGATDAATTQTAEICLPCHTPHGSNTAVANAPLWNHNVDSTAVYTPYTSVTYDADGPGLGAGVPVAASSYSRLCLSCHDGALNVDAIGNGLDLEVWGAAAGTAPIDPDGNLSQNLSNDHPVAFDYTVSEAADAALVASGTPAGTVAGLPLYGAATSMVECSTCHEVHNESGNDFMLRVVNSDSALCLTCHIK